MQTYNALGYLILRQALSPQRVLALREAVQQLVQRALEGEVELKWIDRERGLPERTGHLLHPDKYDPAFGHKSYQQDWHRDIGKPGAEDEAQFLRRSPGWFVQFNALLIEAEHFLHIVPASHLRASTAAELEAAADKSGAT